MRYMIKIQKVLAMIIAIIICSSGIGLFRYEANTVRADSRRVMVSMGDSFSAGEGIEPFYGQNGGEDKYSNPDWLAHRSELSWPGRLQIDGGGAMSTHRDDGQWYFVAASGAETEHINGYFNKTFFHNDSTTLTVNGIPHTDTIPLDPQIDIFDDIDEHVDYVTLTLGGNDAGFADIIMKAATSGRYLNPNGLKDMLDETWVHFENSYSDDDGYHDPIRNRLMDAYRDIAAAVDEDTTIIVAGYPRLINETGGGAFFNEHEAQLINSSVTRFNAEIRGCVDVLRAEGIHICFVSVEEAFYGHGAYSDEPYLNKIMLLARGQDLDEYAISSSYSMHPNDEGARVYAECVQAKIDELENGGADTEWDIVYEPTDRAVALTLDVSGSMDGEPIEQTRNAALEFVQSVFEQEASVAVVTFDYDAYVVAPFSNNLAYLRNVISNIYSGGGTNIEDGLRQAYEMLSETDAEHKMIFLMGDGMPNHGLQGQALIDYANDIKDDGITIYTLGFFQALDSYERADAQALMSALASEGNYYDVGNAFDIVYAFDDVARQISGTRYIYIKIECPVDVSVEYNGEELNSNSRHLNTRTDFGTLTFLENQDDPDDPIKVLRLEEGAEYTINIEGYGKGKMDYTIQFMDEDGEYTDVRQFRNIPITKDTVITTVAGISDATYLNVDEDGDGKTDIYYKAEADSKAEILTNKGILTIFWYVLSFIGAIVVLVWIKKLINYIRYHKYLDVEA